MFLKKLNSMSNKVVKMNNDINSLNLEKNQLLREKEESDKILKIFQNSIRVEIRTRKN